LGCLITSPFLTMVIVSTDFSVQKICKFAGNEKDVRVALDAKWKDPKTSEKVLKDLIVINESLFRFEKMLDAKQSN